MFLFLLNIYRQLPYKYRNIAARLSLPVMLPLRYLANLKPFIVIGEKMYLSPFDNACLKYRAVNKNYELTLTDMFCALASKMNNPVVVDAGANYGIYMLHSIVLARRGLVRNVIAIEPDKSAFKCLNKSVNSSGCNHLVALINGAISSKEGTINLRKNIRSSMDNRIDYGISSDNKFPVKSIHRVNTVNLGQILENDLTVEYIFKIDIEGAEFDAIKTMKEQLKLIPGYTIFFEFFPCALKDSGIKISSFLDLIKEIEPTVFYERFSSNFYRHDENSFYKRLEQVEYDDPLNKEGPVTEVMISNIDTVEKFMTSKHKLEDISETLSM